MKVGNVQMVYRLVKQYIYIYYILQLSKLEIVPEAF
jgi:hypothetical protein